MVGGRRPLEEDNLWWKTTFGRRRPLVEDDLWGKATFLGRQPFVGRPPSLEDNLWWKVTYDRRQPLVEDDLQWMTTFGGRQPSVERRVLVEEDLLWKTTFSGRQPSVEDDLRWWLLPLTVTAQQSPNWKCYQLSQPEIEFAIIEKCMRHCACAHVQKRQQQFKQRWLNHHNVRVGMGGRIIGAIIHHSF